MFLSPAPILAAPDWRETVQRGDIVLFRFPVNKDGEHALPKRRPCLVLDVRTTGDTKFVDLAYGTTSRRRANRGYEVILRHPQSQALAGLDRPTRFVCARRITVSINHSGFIEEGKPRTLLGRLDPPLMERMNAVRARIQAEADIAAYKRERQRAEQTRREHEARGFR
ncbi:type II toxin-antitoxin system PemK/MazF family toxin [Celeribacter halophilus]|uniref:Type II toxin-antitoxin system PemK/MazF family toxin n=1 Tax=Celeribacter halophilus TaxID=576117 RepID=A0AAW7Y1G0_9RHOB|nr:type II toxin-antitoxin system PemK/MazF family toxin [Celeribacter halophilus]MDO6458992.1 type II toxin-antitoxin system PemK/MazF family toxin [Celeribacter halophilus]